MQVDRAHPFLRAVSRPIVVLALAGLPLAASAQERRVPETYTAVTANMTPAAVELKADVLRWSSDEERAAVIAALTEAQDPVAALGELPTLGVVWRSNSAVGAAIKYAERKTAADGSEIVTLVTDKRVGFTSFNPWVAEGSPVAAPPPYSVLQLDTGRGTGTMSLAAEMRIDTAAAIVALAGDTGISVLSDVRKMPPPYWANADE